MPYVKSFDQRYEKYKAKTAPDRVGTRYEAVKDLAVSRYREGIIPIVSVRELARNVLDSNGVPAAQWGMYLAFATKLASLKQKYSGSTFAARANGLAQNFVVRGADPEIISALASLVGATITLP